MKTDDFGARMKSYEANETLRRVHGHLPVVARIDGRAFSNFTRGLIRPFDAGLTEAMIKTAEYLVEHTHAKLGYIQSDEISLVWLADGEQSDIFFSGKIHKMTSVLASMAAARFMLCINPDLRLRFPHFDCRVFQVPTKTEAANAILWRAMDAKKNAISSVAQTYFSPKALHGKGQTDMLSMLADKGVDFESYGETNRRGTFVRRETVELELTADEIANIPERHRPVGPIKRSVIKRLAMPPFNKVINREGVIFSGETPQVGA
jgi:tRNA(His) 5'-end guanylyltransferase